MRWARLSLHALVVVCLSTVLIASRVSAATPFEENPADHATFDPYFPEQWGLTAIKAPQAWTRSTGAGIDIGVIDTGIDLSHEDLASKVAASTNCVGSGGVEAACGGSAQDDQGHGTDVAGIAAAVTDNGRGVAGVAPGARLVAVKALGASGSGSLPDVAAGIHWAVDHGARVINLSLEAAGTEVTLLPGETLSAAVEYAWDHGAIPVVAAGNSTQSLFGSASYAGLHAVIVGATGPDNSVAWYSSPLTGATWGLVAPGGDSRGADGTPSCAGALAADCIVSTGWFANESNAYVDDEGTSMAAPEVAGVLALLLAQGLSPSAAIARMLATTDKVACGTSCAGLLDAAAAVGAPATTPATTTVAPTSTTPQQPPTTPPPPPSTVAGESPTTGPVATPATAPSTTAQPPVSSTTVPAAHPVRVTVPPQATSTTGPAHATAPAPGCCHQGGPGVALGAPTASASSPDLDVPVGLAILLIVGVAAEGFTLRRRSRRPA